MHPSLSHILKIGPAILILTLLAGRAEAQKWKDSMTGKEVPTVPAGGAERDLTDPNRAFNPRTGQNFFRDKDGTWKDSKTGKEVPTVPAGGAERDLTEPNRAFNPRTGQNYFFVPAAPKDTAKDKGKDTVKSAAKGGLLGEAKRLFVRGSKPQDVDQALNSLPNHGSGWAEFQDDKPSGGSSTMETIRQTDTRRNANDAIQESTVQPPPTQQPGCSGH